MNLINFLILIYYYSLIVIAGSIVNMDDSPKVPDVKYLWLDEITYVPEESSRLGYYVSKLHIFCYNGTDKSIGRIFQTVRLHLDIENDDFTQYEGATPEMVKEHYEQQSSMLYYFLSNKKTRLKLDPFNQTCIGIDTYQKYHIKLHVLKIDFWKIAQFAIGMSMYFYADILSHNSLFYYLSGILLGIFASLLVLIYFASKLVPGRRPLMYGVVLCGWSLAIYLIQMLFKNIHVILMTYQTYVIWYILLMGFISFIVCYRIGPPENQRSINLIKWGLQLISLITIFYSSEYQEASAAIIILTLIINFFPRKLLRKFQTYYIRRFPPKLRFLTNEEYYEEGVRETTKALDELRQYANSPECKQWVIIKKLKNPLRFASFVEGSSHISDEEILEYETSRADLTDSELSDDNDDNEIVDNNSSNAYNVQRLQQQQQVNDDDISEDEETNNDVNNLNNTKHSLSTLNSPNGIGIQRNRRYYTNESSISSSTSNYRTYNTRSYRN